MEGGREGGREGPLSTGGLVCLSVLMLSNDVSFIHRVMPVVV